MAQEPLKKTLDSLKRTMDERESAKVYQLALWADPQRGVPNEFARSALFAAVKLNEVRYLHQATLFSQNGFTVKFTGKQLTQSDLDVFEGVMHIARGTPEGNAIYFRAGELLRHIGRAGEIDGKKKRAVGKSQYQWLLGVLNTLTATSVSIIRDGKDVFWGSLLPEGAARMDNGLFRVEINRKLIQLFTRGYTVIEWEQRRQLSRKPLAQHLHAWICSHAKPYPVTVAYLRNLSGSNTKDLHKFRQSLRTALTAIQATGAISAWQIDRGDKVHITKP